MSGYRASGTLSLILLTYVKPLEAVDALMDRHVAWLDAGFAQGRFVVAGRRDPRTGGVILVKADAGDAATIAATDPFVAEGVAVEILAFNASFALPALARLLG